MTRRVVAQKVLPALLAEMRNMVMVCVYAYLCVSGDGLVSYQSE